MYAGARLTARYICLLLLLSAWTQCQVVQKCGTESTLRLDFDYTGTVVGGMPGLHISYQSKSARVGNGRIEIWDLQKRLWSHNVSLNSSGELQWDHLRSIPDAPSYLLLQLYDPDEPSLCLNECEGCEETCQPSRGAVVDEALAGYLDVDEAPKPWLRARYIRLTAGGDAITLNLEGNYFAAGQTVALLEKNSEGEWQEREKLPILVVDVHHAAAVVPVMYLTSPGELKLEGSIESGVVHIVVADTRSPTLTAVEPTEVLPKDAAEGPVTVALKGEGFTWDSKVFCSIEQAGDVSTAIPSEYVSPNELRIELRSHDLIDYPQFRRTDALHFLVANASPTLISQEITLKVNASPDYPDRPSDAQPQSRIRNIVTVPVEQMKADGPDGVQLEIEGANFRPREWVIATTDIDETRLRTRFISSQKLLVWLPRKVWGDHRVRVRFVTATVLGECVAEMVGE